VFYKSKYRRNETRVMRRQQRQNGGTYSKLLLKKLWKTNRTGV